MPSCQIWILNTGCRRTYPFKSQKVHQFISFGIIQKSFLFDKRLKRPKSISMVIIHCTITTIANCTSSCTRYLRPFFLSLFIAYLSLLNCIPNYLIIIINAIDILVYCVIRILFCLVFISFSIRTIKISGAMYFIQFICSTLHYFWI